MKIWLCILVVCTVCFLACERETQAPACPGEPSIDDLILENCLTVRSAAEAFAVESGGEYPIHPRSKRPFGFSLVDFLPDSTLLTNPVTGEATEPHKWLSVCDPPGKGSTVYRVYGSWDTDRSAPRVAGYHILGLGLGKQGDIVVTNVPDSVIALVDSLENAVLENCEAVLWAAWRFAVENNGYYPLALDEESSTFGNTLIDLLPDGQYLENPFTNELTEPIIGVAGTPGQTAYCPIISGLGDPVGCSITGFGCCFVIQSIPEYFWDCDL